MRHILAFTFLILSSLSASSQTEKIYSLDLEKSIVNWKGSYSFHFSEHKGTVEFKEGQLNTEDGNIIGGAFLINMTTINNEENREKGWGPVAHLKDADFFDVTKFPEAKLVITKATYYEDGNHHKIEANLTIKGITQFIEFWPNIDPDKKLMTAKFIIDRTLWGIVYNNKLKNKAISDAVEFEAVLQFK